jgi:hypothetical protein
MLGSVHLVDGGVRAAFGALRRSPSPTEVEGLREARTLIAAPLGGSPPKPQFGRIGLVAFWEDEGALEGFLASHPLAETLAGGWSVRLAPLRAVSVASGHFTGIPDDLPSGQVDSEGPVAVLTLGHLRFRRVVEFLRTSARAEKQVAESPGSLWATGLANPAQRIVATLSLWENTEQMRAYATRSTGHAAALRSEAKRSFHHMGSFVRFRPYAVTGSLDGRNPLPEALTAHLNDPVLG